MRVFVNDEKSDVSVVDYDQLLEKLVNENESQIKDNGDTALHLACKRQDAELARFLCEHGANVDAQNNDGSTPLHIVAANGDEALLRVLHQARANANLADSQDKTPLHVAAENGHTAIVEILCDKFKSSVLARTKDGSTLMHIAASKGHTDTAMAFLKRGVPLYMPNKSGALGLHCAAAMGHVGVIRTLLQKSPENIDARTKDNLTALHVAVQHGQAPAVECLLGFGASVHYRSGLLGITALHLAAALPGAEGMKCSQMLLKSGAEINTKQENGETPLHVAARQGNMSLVKLFLDDGADTAAVTKPGESCLHISAKYCHYPVCKLIIETVAQKERKEETTLLISLQNSEGETAIHYAAEIRKQMCHYPGEDRDIIGLLLEHGGEINAVTNMTAETPVHYCASAGNDDILSEIVKVIGPGHAQIALNKQSKSGLAPLLCACERGHLSLVKILLQHHARVDIFDEHGRTALHLAAEQGHADIVDTLLMHKAFINSKTKLGITPLHLAAMHGHHNVLQLLVQKFKALLDVTTLDGLTPLHVASKYGQLAVCTTLLMLGSNADARDTKGQTPLHLAAESDYPEVVNLFLKLKSDINTLKAEDKSGYTSAHIAAKKGSVAVVKELMNIDREMVISAKTGATQDTCLHLAAAGGHAKVAKALIDAGANPAIENSNGSTPLHLAARFGHVSILDVIDKTFWNNSSKTTGLTALHVASHYGQIEFVRYLLSHVSAKTKSHTPRGINPLMVKELATEYGLTPLHMAAQSGHEGLVRLLLQFQGVHVDVPTVLQSVIPLHLASQSGHVAVVGLLLSRSTHQLHLKDSKGRTSLHLAAMNGHNDMVSLLIGQGSNINAMDGGGWTALHYATRAGHMAAVKMLVESGADPWAESKEGKMAITFAAAFNHFPVLSYLLHKRPDSYALMEDRKFIYDLMVCGKSNNFKPVEEFLLLSIAPIDIAAKLSNLYRGMSTKEKERAKDLAVVAEYCEDIAVELLSIASTESNASLILKAIDNRNRPFLDVLIENEQKKVVSHATVQRYLTEIWNGGIEWGDWKFILFFITLTIFPPLWLICSFPFELKISKAPIIKFFCHLISHGYFILLLVLEVLSVFTPIYEVKTWIPTWVEWQLLLWLAGLLVAELSNEDSKSGLGVIRIAVLMFSAIALGVHVIAFVYPYMIADTMEANELIRLRQIILYVKNQFFAVVQLFCFVGILEFLTVHHLFGPWAIIIRDLMYDLVRFLVILALFVAGFTLHVTSIFQPAFDVYDPSQVRLVNPIETLEMLFFSLFGLVEPDEMPPLHRTPQFSIGILKIVFGVYMMVTLIVLINLLIAMMSDTYQRIQAESDTEWKFGRAKLIRQMNKRTVAAPPANLFTKLFTVLKVAIRNNCNLFSQNAQEDMRYEENIDSFSMSEHSGYVSPAAALKQAHDEMSILPKVELGPKGPVSIESVIDWGSVVNTFYMYQGGGASNKAAEHADAKMEDYIETDIYAKE